MVSRKIPTEMTSFTYKYKDGSFLDYALVIKLTKRTNMIIVERKCHLPDSEYDPEQYRLDKDSTAAVFEILAKELTSKDPYSFDFSLKYFVFTIRYGSSGKVEELKKPLDDGCPQFLSKIESLTGLDFLTGLPKECT